MPRIIQRRFGSEWSRRAVVSAAEKIFAERGYKGADLRTIADASGVSQPLINHHFGSKEKLYDEVRRQLFREFDAYWVAHAPVRDAAPFRYEAVLEGIFRFCQKRPTAVRLLQWSALEGKSFWTERLVATEGVAAELAAEQERGTLRRDLNASLLAAVAQCIVICWWQMRDVSSSQKKRRVRDLDEAFLMHARAILAGGARPSSQPTPSPASASQPAAPAAAAAPRATRPAAAADLDGHKRNGQKRSKPTISRRG